MILSHKYKFIYIKAAKVAGSSVMAALAKQCGEGDRVNAPLELKHLRRSPLIKNPHATVEDILGVVPAEIWKSYYKISIIRNPWDFMVSYYWWVKDIAQTDQETRRWRKQMLSKNKFTFEAFVEHEPLDRNGVFYYYPDGALACDHYMRFENLQEDYRQMCNSLGIIYEELMKLKSDVRKDKKKHYSEYYNIRTKKIVERKYEKHIETFKYKFENIK